MVGFPEDVVAGGKLSNSEQNEKPVCYDAFYYDPFYYERQGKSA
jgi:hypothetical protein